MKKRNIKTFSIVRIIITTILLLLISGIGAITVATQVNTVTIKLSNGYEMTVLTNKTNVSEILEDNNILISEDEKVTPSENESITEENTIVISSKSKQEVQIAKVSESGIETSLDSLLKAYDTIVEKIETVQEEIPYETVKKDISQGASSTENKVLQQGENGIKEITYKVKYQNDTEIERTKISEKVIKEPVDKIVQISSKITSRASTELRTSNTNSASTTGSRTIICKVTAYCSCAKCCGKTNGITASGTKATAGRTVAASSQFSFGTKLLINGKEYVVEDRGGAINGNRIDMFMSSHSAALAWGVKYLPVTVVN